MKSNNLKNNKSLDSKNLKKTRNIKAQKDVHINDKLNLYGALEKNKAYISLSPELRPVAYTSVHREIIRSKIEAEAKLNFNNKVLKLKKTNKNSHINDKLNLYPALEKSKAYNLQISKLIFEDIGLKNSLIRAFD